MTTTTVTPRNLMIRFARKAESLSWVHRELSHLDVRAEMALVVAVKYLTAEEYDAFARQMLRAATGWPPSTAFATRFSKFDAKRRAV